jgi:SM-20-related protein
VGRDGGALRAYLPSRKPGEFVDIAPRAGRLLVFDSVGIEHEVLPTYAPRMALTLWISGADEAAR